MTVSEAILIQREFVSKKYHKSRYLNYRIKESMKVLTKAYDDLWGFLEKNHPNILDEFLINLEE